MDGQNEILFIGFVQSMDFVVIYDERLSLLEDHIIVSDDRLDGAAKGDDQFQIILVAVDRLLMYTAHADIDRHFIRIIYFDIKHF